MDYKINIEASGNSRVLFCAEVVILNESNLIPGAHKLTVEEQSKGGKSSGISRGFRSAVKKRIREHPELIAEIIDALIEMATEEHDLKAMELLIELAGESPRQMEIKIKQQELKIKKENAENQNW